MTPRISIVTPTKNRLALLSEAGDSVRAQDFADWEHIIVDDGSDDGSAEEFARRSADDPRIRFIRREGDKPGANVCRNIGVREARGEFVVFLDSDDLLSPDCLGRRVRAMERNADCDFVTFQTSLFIDTPGDLARVQDASLAGDDLLRFLYFEIPWIITAPVWRRETLLRLGLFDESLPSWQDVELHIRALTAGCRYLRFGESDHHVRRKFDPAKLSMEQRRSPKHLAAADAILETFERLVRQGPGMTWMRQRALCSLYFFVAERWVEAGRLPEGLACWRQIRRRGLGPAALHLPGALFLILQAKGSPVRTLAARIAHKWKGWARLRSNPELVAP